MRRRRVGLTTLAAVVDERAFGFAGDVAVAFRVRGSMFSLFSSSQLAYARRLGTVLVLLLPKPRARALGSGLAQLCASGAPSGFPASSDGIVDGGWCAATLSRRVNVFKATSPPARASRSRGSLDGQRRLGAV